MAAPETPNTAGENQAQSAAFYRTIYWKIATAFVLVLTLSGALTVLVAVQKWEQLIQEIEQKVHWDVAEEFATRIEPFTKDGISGEELRLKLFELTSLNPKLEFYILDPEGNIVTYYAPAGLISASKINLEPLKKAMAVVLPELPVLGDNPHHADRPTIFSVAPLTINHQSGYLYVVVGSFALNFLTEITGQFYVVSSVLWGILFAFIAASLIGWLIFRHLTKNLHSLTDVVSGFGKGDFERRAEVRSDDEIAVLSTTFNDMADRIVSQRLALEERDRQRRMLVAAISHDLRTPIAAMRGCVETLRGDGTQLSTEANRYLDLLSGSVQTQQRLVNDLFEYASLEARERTPDFEPFLLDELLSECVERLTPVAAGKHVTIRADLPETPVAINGDISGLQRVLYNLLENAIRYNRPGGVVTASLTTADGVCQVTVSDTGLGIPEKDLPFIFESFYRAERPAEGDPGGTGLGLAIVKKILELHKSTITVRSELGSGSTFTFDLPIHESA